MNPKATNGIKPDGLTFAIGKKWKDQMGFVGLDRVRPAHHDGAVRTVSVYIRDAIFEKPSP